MDVRRDRDATAARLLDAAARIVVDDGAAALGVNVLAKAAGCDKQLIYRYFGGVEGVQRALGEAVAARLQAALSAELPQRADTWPHYSRALAHGLLAACRADPLMCRLRAAELAAPAGSMEPFAAARRAMLHVWLVRVRPSAPPPPGVDVGALHALVVGAIEAAVLSAAAGGALAAMPLHTPADWTRLDRALDAMIAAVYAQGTAG